MTKLDIEYFYNKNNEIEKKFDKHVNKYKSLRPVFSSNKKMWHEKIKKFLTNFLNLKDEKNYYIEYSLKNRFKLYYWPTSNIKDKKEILDIEIIYDKKEKKYIDFTIMTFNLTLKTKTASDNFNIINKVIKRLLKKDLFFKKYNILIEKRKLATKKIYNKSNDEWDETIGYQNQAVENHLHFINTFLLEKEFLFQKRIEEFKLFHRQILIQNPISCKIELINSSLYKLIIKAKPNKEYPSGVHSYEIKKNILDDFITSMSQRGAFYYK